MLIEIFWIAYFANGFFLNYKKFCTSSPHLRHTWLSLCHSLCFAAPARACPKLPICASEHPRRWYPAPHRPPSGISGSGGLFPCCLFSKQLFSGPPFPSQLFSQYHLERKERGQRFLVRNISHCHSY